jgi:hypothetical protein
MSDDTACCGPLQGRSETKRFRPDGGPEAIRSSGNVTDCDVPAYSFAEAGWSAMITKRPARPATSIVN